MSQITKKAIEHIKEIEAVKNFQILNMNNQMNIINPNMKDKGKEINIYTDIDDLAPLLEMFMIDDVSNDKNLDNFINLKNKLHEFQKKFKDYKEVNSL